MTEADIFGSGERDYDIKNGIGWAIHQYQNAREDLLFVMDDSWDVPGDGSGDAGAYFGSLILEKEKFPGFFGEGEELEGKRNTEAMKRLSDKIKSLGWRGLGGWVCLQRSPLFENNSNEEYWSERLRWAGAAGWRYWKVDWGNECGDIELRKLMTDLGKKIAPALVIEHAMMHDIIPHADSFRTYDVYTLLSIPMTMNKLAEDLIYETQPGYDGIVNCEDEVYIAAALGCAAGVMRHNMTGNLPNGDPDASFPALHRNLKTKTDEVTRMARWHRIAPAFGANGSRTFIDSNTLTDYWNIARQADEIEAWWGYHDGDRIEMTSPARISRCLSPAEVSEDEHGFVPFVISSLHPSGAASVATLARTQDRHCFTPICDVTQDCADASVVGVFGIYKSLTLKTSAATANSRVLMQDLLAENAYDITSLCTLSDGSVTIPGEVITEIGQSGNHAGDTSEPGAVVRITE